MEEDLSYNVMMVIIGMEMDVVLIVKWSRDIFVMEVVLFRLMFAKK